MRIKTLAAAGLIAVMTTGAASAWPHIQWTGGKLIVGGNTIVQVQAGVSGPWRHDAVCLRSLN